jgi:rod shape-determining protein MreC
MFLAGVFFVLFSFSSEKSLALRQAVINTLSCFWDRVYVLTYSRQPSTMQKELERLQQDNYVLRMQIDHVRQWLLSEDRIHEQIELLNSITNQSITKESEKQFLHRRCQQIIRVLQLESRAVPAKVIFREPGTWSNYIWVNVGEEDNQRLQETIIAKNSPVMVANSVVGVIDLVCKTKSRVRLITDNRLTISVRAVRGKEQDYFLLDQLNALLFSLEKKQSVYSQEVQEAISVLVRLKKQLIPRQQTSYLAKGELHGTGRPLWRSCGSSLKGKGFNYDFADEEGPGRDLRSGIVYEKDSKLPSVTLLQVGDLLVTTGLDGVFPAGLHVAVISKVHTLQEGECSYNLEATAAAGNLDEFSCVCVLPALD